MHYTNKVFKTYLYFNIGTVAVGITCFIVFSIIITDTVTKFFSGIMEHKLFNTIL